MNHDALNRDANHITIRHVRPQDRHAWEPLYRQYADFYRVVVDDTIVQRTWSWLMDPEHPVEGLVAESENGELVGLAHFRPVPETLIGRDSGFLDDLYVPPSQRGTGTGRALIAAVTTIARSRGWPFVRWVTANDNATARRLYDGIAQETAWVTYDLTVDALTP
ncbi:GNAT family N-acetyltransferase [Pandoraea pulmonicola]|uniref:GNAT family N-acetyltransferase n=1 Tax=Pandoraea pulmonicola TaxID=93221 RepID=A0AAJ5D058_PANPU|nr:GNAT family N-acetyltransferase [Pandoraea pulmonicola]AJC21049.1 GNAT family N-acetyltransferase [Pandoraea pulmonicola]SUA90304.1 Predicted acetyltransferase [Pandoraea pulmonicola]